MGYVEVGQEEGYVWLGSGVGEVGIHGPGSKDRKV